MRIGRSYTRLRPALVNFKEQPRPEPEGWEEMGNWCKHYTGIHNNVCKKEHKYLDFGPAFGIANIIPCILRNENPKPCPDLELKTKEEIAAEDKEFDDLVTGIFRVRPLIVSQGKRQGRVPCPQCGAIINYTIAANGHIHAGCTTDGCIRWME